MIRSIRGEAYFKKAFFEIIDKSKKEEFFQLFNNFLIDKNDDGLKKLHKFLKVNDFLNYLLKEGFVNHNFSSDEELIDFINFYYKNDLNFINLIDFFRIKNVAENVYRRELLNYMFSIKNSFSKMENIFEFIKDLEKEYSISNIQAIIDSINYKKGYGFSIVFDYYDGLEDFKAIIEKDNIERKFNIEFDLYEDLLGKLELLEDLVNDKNSSIVLESMKSDINKIFKN